MTNTAPNILTISTSGEDRSREQIEQAAMDQPFCEACGATTLPVADGDAIWLVCSATQGHRTMLRRILSFEALMGHTHQLVIENVSERLAA